MNIKKEHPVQGGALVTTPIYYVNAKPHLGTLYSTVLADVAARWHRLCGERVFFLTGTDEHGQKIETAARSAGVEPKVFVDRMIPAYKSLWEAYGVSYDYFIRTTDHAHVKAVQQWIEQLLKSGDIYKGFYEGWYCVPCESYVTTSKAVMARDDKNNEVPTCPNCNRPTTLVAEESYFFRLSAYQDRLLEFYEKNPSFIVPSERAHEVINLVKEGLKDLSISRTTLTWGIPFPNDPKHVTYVWADALNNYITAIGWGDPKRVDEFHQWWPATVHVMGKDIIRFHAIYWPAFLMALGLPMPKQLLVHGWINVGGQKMSKSIGNVVDPVQLCQTYGAESVRYYLTRQLAVTHDGEFSIEDLEQKLQTDLANDLGNLLNRMVLLAQKYDVKEVRVAEAMNEPTQELRKARDQMVVVYRELMQRFMYHQALSELWKFIGQVNAYFHGQEPWKLATKDRVSFEMVLAQTAQSLYVIGTLLWPVMPQTMERLVGALGKHIEMGAAAKVVGKDVPTSFVITTIPPLFAKIETTQEKAVTDSVQSQPEKVAMPTITIDDFSKVVLLVGTIKTCDVVPKSEKLYQLSVDFGEHGTRTILSGVRQYLTQEEVVGKQGVFVFNLAPRMMLGIESQGMMLTAKTDGKLTLVTVQAPMAPGTRLS